MPPKIASPANVSGISSMATRQVFAELCVACEQQCGVAVAFQSAGGVDVAKRVRGGEPFDLVVLASSAIDELIAAGHLVAASKVDLVRSGVSIAVRSGMSAPDIGCEDAVREAVRRARSIGYSTGPSGVQLARLFERWGIAAEVKHRIVIAPPGVPVGRLVASGEVELGFQQHSELMHLEGITVVGALPPAIQIVTTFSAAICASSARAEAARRVLDFMSSPRAADVQRRHGMEPA